MNGHHWLIRRNRVYYIRVRIPNYLIYLVKTSEFRYSLKTYNYYEALAKLPKESYKINLKINFLKGVDMRIRKGEIILSDEDIDRLVIHKLKQIEEVFENHYEEVANRQYDISSLTFFNSSAGEMPTPNAELDSIEIFIKEYFRDLKSDKRIDIHKNIYSISSDTKIISKILEIHIFPELLKFADYINYDIELPECQNYYPDITFINRKDNNVKFAVDFKSTYRKDKKDGYCNGFTLGSHGEYFINRNSKKNIQYPYNSYKAHFCLGIIYSRVASANIDETKTFSISELNSIDSVIKDIDFFFVEKWKIASDISGSGNTANIGSITNISDLKQGNGIFSKYGEEMFDDYWMNYGKITIQDKDGKTKKITKLSDFLEYRRIK